MATKSAYFANTIFVFIGDHGVAGNANGVYPSLWTTQRLTDHHVPLLFYAPGLLAPQRRSEVVSQIDVMPTIAGLLHRTYQNRTLGRDLLDPRLKNHFAFITNAADRIGVVTDEHFYIQHLNGGEEQLFSLDNVHAASSEKENKRVRQSLSELSFALFESSRYLLMNNPRN